MRQFFLVLVSATIGVWADSPDEPGDHFFIVPSPGNKFHAVQTVRRWKDSQHPRQFGRLQVFDTESGKELWRMEGVLADQGGVFPADDGVHLVILEQSLWGIGDRLKRDQPIIRFYARERLLKSYTLNDLRIDGAKLPHSVSHTQFYIFRPALGGWNWEWPLGTEAAENHLRFTTEPNPSWREGIFELKTADEQRFRFDPRTGNQVPANPK
jgi:hypothetical protein